MDVSAWDAAAVGVKALLYAATLGAAGGLFFLAGCRSLLTELQARRLRAVIRVLLILAALLSLARVLVTAGSMTGEWAAMFDPAFERMILKAGEGRAVAIRLAGLLLILLGVRWPRLFAIPALVGAVAAATSFAWVGHIHALPSPAVSCLIISLHLLAVAIWIGGLAPLLLSAGDVDLTRIAAVTRRFGALALWVVAVLLAAGVGLLCTLLGSFDDLWRDDYGRLIMIKLGFVALLLAAAAFNRLRLTPRLTAQDARAAVILQRSIGVELAAAGIIFVLTAMLTTLTGP